MITATDAVYGFAAWLTCRRNALVVGANNDAAPMAQLCDEWCTTNGIPEVSGDYPGNIKQPAEKV